MSPAFVAYAFKTSDGINAQLDESTGATYRTRPRSISWYLRLWSRTESLRYLANTAAPCEA